MTRYRINAYVAYVVSGFSRTLQPDPRDDVQDFRRAMFTSVH